MKCTRRKHIEGIKDATVGKIRASVFWNTYGIIFVDKLENGKQLKKLWKNGKNEEEKNLFLPRQCTVSQVIGNNEEIGRIAVAFSSTLVSRSGTQRLLFILKSQTLDPCKKYWLDEEVIAETNAYFYA